MNDVRYTKTRFLLFLLVLTATTSLFAFSLTNALSVSVSPEVRSAYQTRGFIIEDRPVAILPVHLDCKTHSLGTWGVWSRTLSSLTDRRASVHRHAFYQRDWGFRWRYAYAFNDEWSLVSEFNKVWMLFEGYRGKSKGTGDHTFNEWRLREELKNPYINAYVYMRRCIEPDDWFYSQIGVNKPITLAKGLVFTPSFYAELANDGLFNCRYAPHRPDGGGWKAGIQALNLMLQISYRINENLSVFGGVHQFCMVHDDAREVIKSKTAKTMRRDLTIGNIGLRLSF